jgi:hypothetical protein
MHIAPGISSRIPNGVKVDTHLCVLGATNVAEMAAQGLKELSLPLSQSIK